MVVRGLLGLVGGSAGSVSEAFTGTTSPVIELSSFWITTPSCVATALAMVAARSGLSFETETLMSTVSMGLVAVTCLPSLCTSMLSSSSSMTGWRTSGLPMICR